MVNDGPGTVRCRIPNRSEAIWTNFAPTELFTFNYIEGLVSSALFITLAAGVARERPHSRDFLGRRQWIDSQPGARLLLSRRLLGDTALGIIASTLVRAKIHFFTVAAGGTPVADNVLQWLVRRFTVAGTSTAVVPTQIDAGSPGIAANCWQQLHGRADLRCDKSVQLAGASEVVVPVECSAGRGDDYSRYCCVWHWVHADTRQLRVNRQRKRSLAGVAWSIRDYDHVAIGVRLARSESSHYTGRRRHTW